ncbi:MAG: efflux RND transporter periplasmic adaptor subunit [Bacteroidaceae bacterium]|nr:efflux RND transporter periplasmic adaptor subunit [Bacteroidaceae bacterium]
MKKHVKLAGLVVIALIFLGTFVFLYQKSQPQVKRYEIHTPQLGNIEKSTVVTGSIEPRDEVNIKPQISGIITELYKQPGEMVKKNEVIAKVRVIADMGSLSSAENRVELANINIKQAEKEFNRMKKLYADKVISTEEYEKAEVNYNQAQAELLTAKDQLNIVREGISLSNADMSTTLIRSTIDGLILDIPVKVGNSVILSNSFNDGTTIASVADMSDLIFKGKIDETEVGRVHEGMPVTITIGALQDVKLNAKLEYISPKAIVENGANQFEIKAAISLPGDITIRSGYSANAEIVLQRLEKVLTIPESALDFEGDSSFVHVLTDSVPEQKFTRRKISTGLSDGIKIEVKGGITAKDKIRGIELKD